jgi:tellurite resistance protein TerA
MSEKISLSKSDPTVSLAKVSVSSGQLRINLNWNQFPDGKPSGWRSFLGGNDALDLDLGCLVELQNGEATAVQALGNGFGSLSSPPFIQLDQDDRTGQSTDGENLFINLEHFSDIKRILVFAFIYEGAPSWDKAKGIVTLCPPSGPVVEVVLDEYASGNPMCAIALISNVDGEVKVERQVKYCDGHESLDEMFGWGLRWTAGSK